MKTWASYVALGDSYTEGLWDVPPDTDPHDNPPVRGWADRLAESLSRRRVEAGLPPLQYANLAVRGRLLEPIIEEQLPRALAMRPELVSIVGGGNDSLRPSMDPDKLARLLEDAVKKLRAEGIDVLMGTASDVKGSPILSAIRPRAGIFTANIYSIARRHGAYVLDQWGHRAIRDWRMWSDDRIHLSTEGHRRVADAALVALGLEPDDPQWETPLPPEPVKSLREAAAWNAAWVKDWVAPWLQRRIQRTSSGAVRTAKRPELRAVTSEVSHLDETSNVATAEEQR